MIRSLPSPSSGSQYAVIALISIVVLTSGCASTVKEREFYDHNQITTLLRSHVEGSRAIDRGFQHPVVITEEQLRTILGSLEVRVDEYFQDAQVKPAIHPTILPGVSRALSESLAAADSSEEVALSAVRKSRRFGVFSEQELTSFVAYVKDDILTISLSRVDWNLKNLRTSANNQKQLPKPKLGEKQMDFRVVQNPDYEAAGAQAVGVRYADPRWDVVGLSTIASEPAPDAGEPEAAAPETTTPATPPPTP